jgi:hypothetical protein
LQPVEENNLHKLRRALKDVLFTWNYVQEQAAKLMPYEMNTLEKLQTLTALLGAYGDQCAALDLLQPHNINKLPTAEGRSLLEKARMQFEDRKQHFRVEFFATLLNMRKQPEHPLISR